MIPRLHLPVRRARSIRNAVRLAAGSSLALGLAGVSSMAGHGGVLPAGAQVDPVAACAYTTTTAGATTTLTFANVGTCTLSAPYGGTLTVTLWGAAGGVGAQSAREDVAPAPVTAPVAAAPVAKKPIPIPIQVEGTPGTGGEGAQVTGTVTAAPGTTFELNVGGVGTTDDTTAGTDTDAGAGGSNGGGAGTFFGGGGGGASDLRAGAFGTADRILVAGGGGGRFRRGVHRGRKRRKRRHRRHERCRRRCHGSGGQPGRPSQPGRRRRWWVGCCGRRQRRRGRQRTRFRR